MSTKGNEHETESELEGADEAALDRNQARAARRDRRRHRGRRKRGIEGSELNAANLRR